MEYVLFGVVLVIVSFGSWCVGVRMGAAAAVQRVVDELGR
jgi:hypothetical protein